MFHRTWTCIVSIFTENILKNTGKDGPLISERANNYRNYFPGELCDVLFYRSPNYHLPRNKNFSVSSSECIRTAIATDKEATAADDAFTNKRSSTVLEKTFSPPCQRQNREKKWPIYLFIYFWDCACCRASPATPPAWSPWARRTTATAAWWCRSPPTWSRGRTPRRSSRG